MVNTIYIPDIEEWVWWGHLASRNDVWTVGLSYRSWWQYLADSHSRGSMNSR